MTTERKSTKFRFIVRNDLSGGSYMVHLLPALNVFYGGLFCIGFSWLIWSVEIWLGEGAEEVAG